MNLNKCRYPVDIKDFATHIKPHGTAPGGCADAGAQRLTMPLVRSSNGCAPW
jgi:hypothetical protein